MTATHLSELLHMRLDSCSRILSELATYDLVECLNAEARKNRVYYVTNSGAELQDQLCDEQGEPRVVRYCPEIDWNVFGKVLSTHRLAVLKTLARLNAQFKRPARACEIRKRAVFDNPNLRMSANNVRDVLKDVVELGVVNRVKPEGERHWHYQLSAMGVRVLEYLLVLARRLEAQNHV